MDAALLQRIDFLRLAINLGGNRKSMKEMLGLFLRSAEASLDKLETAQHDSNIILWLQIAHQLKGASHNITAKRLVSLCLEAEEIGELPHEQTGAVVYHLRKELAILREAIDKHLESMP
jgi:HPt (histidine-containing phosphotransfer) domain-containing protein